MRRNYSWVLEGVTEKVLVADGSHRVRATRLRARISLVAVSVAARACLVHRAPRLPSTACRPGLPSSELIALRPLAAFPAGLGRHGAAAPAVSGVATVVGYNEPRDQMLLLLS